MRKNLVLGLAMIFSCFSVISCDPWEDENDAGGGGDDPNGPEVTMLLKEIKLMTGETEGKVTYSFDGQQRLTKTVEYDDISDQTTYVETTYQYPGEGKINLLQKAYAGGELLTTNSAEFEILSSSQIHALIQNDFIGEINSDITYSTPCGISKIVNTIDVGNGPETTTQTFEFFDQKCSSMEYLDGDWEQTIFNDDKFSPKGDPLKKAIGVTERNPIKFEMPGNDIETITYQYNENGYPISAMHTFSPESGEENYTETFIYQ